MSEASDGIAAPCGKGASALHTLIKAIVGGPFDQGCSGNLSVRDDDQDAFWITPSARPYASLDENDAVKMTCAGAVLCAHTPNKPSSEWGLHRDLYRDRPEVRAILHAHSPFATALACQGEGIPAFHYMVARFGGVDIRCAPYALFGTDALSRACVAGIKGRFAVLLAHHGMVVCSTEVAALVPMALEFEALCEHFWRTRLLGPPPLLSPEAMEAVLARFVTYRGEGAA